MKNYKFLAIALFLAFATVSMSMADGFHTRPKKVTTCTLQKACQCPSLIHAILVQVDPSFLNVNQQYYTVEIVCNNVLYQITGSHAQWIWFYSQEWTLLLKKTVKIVEDY